jgi:hypothetical protein
VNPQLLDVVVLDRDLATHGLRRGDLGTVVEVAGPHSVVVEFVAASGRTQALVTLKPSDIRAVNDNDLISVRPSRAMASHALCQHRAGAVSTNTLKVGSRCGSARNVDMAIAIAQSPDR